MTPASDPPDLIEACLLIVKQTNEWNDAVEKIIGRQPRTGIGVIELDAAITAERALRRECANVVRDLLSAGDRLGIKFGMTGNEWTAGVLATRGDLAALLARLEKP